MKNLKYILMGAALVSLSACENGNQEFDDYDVQTIYFATQTPVLTLTLGEDGDYDTSLDQEHIFEVYVTLGGVNTNKKDRWAELEVDNSLVTGVTYADDGRPVLALPSNYYTIESTRVTIKKGAVMGAMRVYLNDAFFQDPLAASTNYVLPLRIVSASEKILEGTVADGVTSPNPVNSADYSETPRNYTLYGVKFKNLYTGSWLSRGTVTTDINGTATTSTHENANGYWEKEEIHYLTSNTINTCYYSFSHAVPVTAADGSSKETTVAADLLLTFADSGAITVTSDTAGVTASGSGQYTYHGLTKAWGDKDRDKIELNYSYTIPYTKDEATGEQGYITVTTQETLCFQSRLNAYETFSYNYN